MSGATLKRTLVALPGVGVSLLPKLMCPACWPAVMSLMPARRSTFTRRSCNVRLARSTRPLA